MIMEMAAINPQIHTGLFSLVCRIQKRRKACVLEGFHLPLKYIQNRMRIVPIATTDQGTGMIVNRRTQMPTPKELTTKPIITERTAKGTFIQNRPKALEG
jgi:hypothetical protein